jgi:hypothetical protein
VHAAVAAARDHDPARCTTHVGWSAELAIPVAMAVKPESAAGGPGRRAAVDACTRSRGLYRRWRCKPPLDVERVMNDSWSASGRLQQGPTGSTTSMVLAHRRRHLFGEPYAQLRRSELASTSSRRTDANHPR